MRNIVNILYKLRFLIIAVMVIISVVFYRSSEAPSRFSQTQLLMGTNVTVDVCAASGREEYVDQAYDLMWQRLDNIGWRMNVYDPKSDVSKINNAPVTQSIVVGSDTYFVMKKAVEASIATDGAFDVTIWPLLKFWREHSEKDTVPSQEAVEEVKTKTGINHISLLENGTIKKLNEAIKVDLGGIAKGYAIDEAARILRENGFQQFYINAGGDIYVGGEGCAGDKWHIGIRDPQSPENTIAIVAVADAAVTTSGNYEQFYRLKNKKLSHIIDPRTGYPQEGVISSTVIAPSALEADIYSTALTILDVDQGLDLINAKGSNYGSLLFTESLENGILERFASGGFERFLVDNK